MNNESAPRTYEEPEMMRNRMIGDEVISQTAKTESIPVIQESAALQYIAVHSDKFRVNTITTPKGASAETNVDPDKIREARQAVAAKRAAERAMREAAAEIPTDANLPIPTEEDLKRFDEQTARTDPKMPVVKPEEPWYRTDPDINYGYDKPRRP